MYRYTLHSIIHKNFSLTVLVLVFVLGFFALPASGQQIIINSGATLKNTGATIVVNGKINNAGTITNSNTNTLKLTGDWQNDGTFTPTGCTVNLLGTATQTLGGTNATTFENMTLNNTNGVTLLKGITISNLLTFTAGKISTGTNTLSLGNSATVTGAGAGKYVFGNFEKGIAASTVSKYFEIGDALYYTPVTLTFTGTTNAVGKITAKTTSGDHPDISGTTIDPALSVNRNWTITNTGVTGFSSSTATFTFDPSDVDAGANYNSFVVGKYLSSAWSYPAVGSATSTSTQATGLTAFGDFQIGNYLCTSLPAPTVTSPVNYCQYATAVQLTAIGTNLMWNGGTTSGSVGGSGIFTLYDYVSFDFSNKKTNFTTTSANVTINTVNYYITPYQSVSNLVLAIFNSSGTAIAVSSTSTTQSAGATALTKTNAFNYTIATAGNYSIGLYSGTGNIGYDDPAFPITEVTGTISITGVTTPQRRCFNDIQFTSSGSSTAPTPVTTVVGTTNYTVNQSAFGCVSPNATIAVVVSALPSATISYAGSPFCTSLVTGQSVTQTGTVGGIYSSTAGLTINASTGAITPGTSTAGTYTVTYTMAAAGGCSAQNTTTSVLITAAPTASGSSTETCVGGSTGTITASGSGGLAPYTYSLNAGAYQASATFTGLAAGTYTVNTKSNAGCIGSTSVTVTPYATSTDNQNAAATDSWIGHMYDGTNFNNYLGHFTEAESFNELFGGNTSCFDVVSNSLTRSIYTETFSVKFRMNSTRRGLYTVNLGSDDGSRLTVDAIMAYNNWTDQSFVSRPTVLINLTGTSSLLYEYYENGGVNQIVFQNLTQILSNTLATNVTQNICLGSSGNAISGDAYGTLPSGISLSGTGYQWTYSTTPAGSRTDISGATGATYIPNTTVSPFNTTGTFYIFRNGILSSTNNVSPIPYVAANESNAATIIIDAPAVATFSYTGSPYCKNASNPFPTFSGGGMAGVFSSTAGLVFVSTATGQVNLTASTAGTYTVTNTIAASGGCGAISTTSSITITTLPAATITYAGTPFCQSLATSQPVSITGTTGGTFTTSPAGLTIDAATGALIPSTSSAGAYTVTYTIAAAGGCGIVTATTPVTITTLPVATFSYAGTAFPVFSGGGVAGVFSSTAGLIFVSTSTGEVNLTTSTPGTYTVTNTIAASGGCGVVTATSQITITGSQTVGYVWGGSVSTDWNVPNNWTSGIVPGLTNDAVIPDAATTLYDPVLPTSPAGSVKTIVVQVSGILNGGAATSLTVAGSSTAWQNLGTFNAGTSTVIFTNANATLSGTTNFNNVTVATGAKLTPASGNMMRIAGALTLQGTGVLSAASVANTIEFNGANQTVINPNGSTAGYYHLILSGSGTKTLPGTALAILGNFSLSGTSSATAIATLAVTGNLTIGSGTTFSAGALTHTVGGNWTNSGTFTSTGSTINFNGSSASTIGVSNFNHLAISGTGTKTATGTISASGNFDLTSGAFVFNNSISNSISISGNYTQTGGLFDFNTKTSGSSSMFLGGNLTQTSGAESITTSGEGALNGVITFNGSGTQALSCATPNGIIWTVFSIPSGNRVQLLSNIKLNSANGVTQIGFQGSILVNGTLDLGTSTVIQEGGVSGTAVFTVFPGANLITANAGGISGSVIPTRITTTYSSAANYEFRGASTGTFITTPAANTVNNLTINNASAVALTNSINVAGLLTLTDGALTLGTNTLTISGITPVRTSGTINAVNAGSTITFTNSTAIVLPASLFTGNVNNLTINSVVGITAVDDLGINGVLYLQSANPLATKGSLDMWDGTVMKTLTMGADATTVGLGDVTGIVKRTSFVANTSYTFGNEYTAFTFEDVGTLPTDISMKIIIGAAPAWKTDGIERITSIIRTGGSGAFMTLNTHYLDSELNGNAESGLVGWICFTPFTPGTAMELSRSNFDMINNYVGINGFDVSYLPTSFDIQSSTLGVSILTNSTWNGSISTSWTNPDNWTPFGIPSYNTDVLIPDEATTPNDPTTIPTILIGRLTLQSNAILNAINSSTITLSGGSGAWINNLGIFNASTSMVIFTNDNPTISGTTNFYDVTIPDTVVLWLTSGSIMRIAGAITNNGTWRTVIGGPTIVEYNGGNQIVVVPNPATNRYSTLILSGTGNKTMPATALGIYGDFEMAGSASATAQNILHIADKFTLGTGTTFVTGSLNHIIGGNFINNGTFTGTGSTITFDGILAQTIGGTAATTFNNLISNNTAGAKLTSDALTTVSGALLINSGKKLLVAPGIQLTSAGTITNNGGISGFVLQSDTTGTASLLHTTNSVPATVQRYVNGSAEDWHFLSSPVSAQEISGAWLPSGTYGNDTGYDLYLWDEPTTCWIYKLNTTSTVNWGTVHPGSNFTIGRGYLYSVQAANPTKEFAGNANNGSLTYGLTFNSLDLSLKGFNLVGNPYPSSMDWGASSGWTRTDLLTSGSGYDMWIWNPAAENYGVCNSFTGSGTNDVTRYIAPMQGFFVRASVAGNLGMDNTVRLHDATGKWFKDTEINRGLISLVVQSETDKSYDEIQMQFGNATNESGAAKLFSQVLTAPSLYMPSGSDNFSVRYLTDTIDNPTVPVMFKPGTNGNYMLKCNFNSEDFETLTLEDRQAQNFQNLKTLDTYTFQSSKQDDANRFVLHFGAENQSANNELPARIYVDGTRLMVDLSLVGGETEAFVYDAIGRILLQKTLQGSTLHELNINSSTQILLVQLRNKQGNLCRKLFYKN